MPAGKTGPIAATGITPVWRVRGVLWQALSRDILVFSCETVVRGFLGCFLQGYSMEQDGYKRRITAVLYIFQVISMPNFSPPETISTPKIPYCRYSLVPLLRRYVPAGNTGTTAATGTTPRVSTSGCSHMCQAISQAH